MVRSPKTYRKSFYQLPLKKPWKSILVTIILAAPSHSTKNHHFCNGLMFKQLLFDLYFCFLCHHHITEIVNIFEENLPPKIQFKDATQNASTQKPSQSNLNKSG
jgi:hypothetical protein